jgi:RecA-family ATPase
MAASPVKFGMKTCHMSVKTKHARSCATARLLVNQFGFTEPRAKSDGDAANGGQRADWNELVANIVSGADLHDAARDLAAAVVAAGMSDAAAERLLYGLMHAAAVPHDARWQARVADIGRAVTSAREKFGAEAEQHKPPPQFIDMSNWDSIPVPPRDWSVLDRIPLRQTTLFSGEGAVGKSIVLLQLSSAHALARDWLGTMPEPGAAIYLDAEDDGQELHRRLAAILDHYQAPFAEAVAGGLHLMSLAGQDAVLAAPSRGGKIEPTPLYKHLLALAGDIKPKLIGIASSANVYAGSEIDRSQVQQFISLLTRLAIVANGAVVLVSHPSLTGLNTDSGLSGSTAWHNSVRARFYMKSVKPEEGQQPDTDLREITFKKNNYGPVSANLVLRYQNGLFLPVPGLSNLERAARDAEADTITVDQLRKDEMNLSNNPHAHNYAPRIFARTQEAQKHGLTERDLEAAMHRLLAAGKIRVERYGRPSEPRYRLVLNG